MKTVIVPEGIKKIGSYWFWDSGIESVTIPSDIEEIGAEAFFNCKQLEKLVFKKVKGNSITNAVDCSADQSD